MDNKVIFAINSDNFVREQIVYGHSWNTFEGVFDSQKCWYTGGEYIVTNTVTGEQAVFHR